MKYNQMNFFKKYIFILSILISFNSFGQNPIKKYSCCIDNLKGKELLDIKFLKEIKKIKPNLKKVEDTQGMVFIKGGVFQMGADIPEHIEGFAKSALPQSDEFPKHLVQVSDFYMDTHEVTVKEYLEFVEATGYKTVAEYDIDWKEIKKQLPKNTPKPNQESLKAGALVFKYPQKNSSSDWWVFVKGANWKNPDGETKDLHSILNLPVTQISWYDALAYARWVGKRLPTEAEFEYAMRGGKNNQVYSWGNQNIDNGKTQGNFWQGVFPYSNTSDDGYEYLSPVGSFAPNAFGLYDMAGNVWEWTSDWYSPTYYQELESSKSVVYNPKGPDRSKEFFNENARSKVIRGGSFLCNQSWCSGYRNSRRMRVSPDSALQHLGFRLVKDVVSEQ